MNNHYKIAVIGLGYVGLPLARLFATKYSVIGFDINQNRIEELNSGNDSTLEVDNKDLQEVLLKNNPIENNEIGLFCSSDINDIKKCKYLYCNSTNTCR